MKQLKGVTMKYLLTIALAFGFVACSNEGPKGNQGDPGTTTVVTAPPVTPSVTPEQALIDQLVADENDYRLSQGSTMLSSGLSCTLYTFTSGDRIQASISGHNTLTGLTKVTSYTYNGVFNQPDSPVSAGMNVLPVGLQSVYQNMYELVCTGQVVVTDTDNFDWQLTSDDGSLLYLDGALLIDNDNNHGAVVANGIKFMRKGVHAITLKYAQSGAGSQALVLNVGSIAGSLSLLAPQYLYH